MLILSLAALLAKSVPIPDTSACQTPIPIVGPNTSAALWIARAKKAEGWTDNESRVLQLHAVDAVLQSYQSDRTYPPFFSGYQTLDLTLDPATGVERQALQGMVFPGGDSPGSVLLSTGRNTFALRDTLIRAPNSHTGALTRRALNPWAELADWSADTGVRLAGHCRYRDYDRIALSRTGPFGPELLLIDPKTGYPVALTRTEPHYLWGQYRVEYVYSLWIEDQHISYPGAAFRMTEGVTDVSRTADRFSLTARDSAPSLLVPNAPAMPPAVAAFLLATTPDTIRVSANTYLLRNPGYTEAVTLARDTVFVFDATQADARARADSAWIGKLFPGRHPVVVIVTDVAWPHVSGVRFWVASGATIVSHRASRAFLQQVVDRRWTLAPDKLERTRPRKTLVFRAVSDSLELGGGAIGLYGIDGVASETALMGFVRENKFLWASDFVQTLSQATQYGREVANAARRVGIAPERLAAEHLPLSQWSELVRVLGDSTKG